MDARIVAEAAVVTMTAVAKVRVVVTIKVDDLVRKLISQFDPAAILAPLLSFNSTSRSAVSPDFILKGGTSGLAIA